MAKNTTIQSEIGKIKKRQWRSWLIYQISVAIIGTSMIVSYVYTPTGGWQHQWSAIRNKIRTFSTQVAAHIGSYSNGITPAPVSTKPSATAGEPNVSDRISYTLHAQLLQATHSIEGTEDIWIPQLNDKEVNFYLFTEDDQPIQIQAVTMGKERLPFSTTEYNLHVALPTRMKDANLHIQFRTPVLQGGFRYGEIDDVWTIGYWYPMLAVRTAQGNWIPTPTPLGFGDPFIEDNADYDVTWTSPSNFHWFTTGSLLATRQANHLQTSEWKITNVRNFAMVGSPNFIDHPITTSAGTTVHIVTLKDSTSHEQQLHEIVNQAVAVYTKDFGMYYYPELSVVEMPSGTVFAQEYPGLALFSSDIWNWPTDTHWIAHEIAHGWWYYSVGDYEAITEWLDEGLAEYSSLLYLEATKGKQAYAQQLNDLRKLWLHQESLLPDGQTTKIPSLPDKIDQPYDSFHTAPEYYYMIYLRTTLMYADLREKMGDRLFFDWLRQFYLKNSGHVATRKTLTEALQDTAPAFVPVLNQWLDTPNKDWIPHVQAETKTGQKQMIGSK
ncbi:hypothetical protein LSG31_04985 [Fodinisporobacter ferrooxydans]|uniref:Peptidase M1 membrane alanine aminopeptidase domain-containing protein n=1 Tax=Fodinisporobacter ferrooxydans TaxID=2901836 RepID=A0ABY4CQW9_9BACL|nr:hypothetical protein LSG31_04985 [Alicyclobacillaceae bacterium MYW30-H2]